MYCGDDFNGMMDGVFFFFFKYRVNRIFVLYTGRLQYCMGMELVIPFCFKR